MAFSYQIGVTPPGGGPQTEVLLLDSNGAPGAGEVLEETRSVQVVELVRGYEAGLRARGNRQLKLRFNSTRVHESALAAVSFQYEHVNSVPESGTVRIEIVDGNYHVKMAGECVVSEVRMLRRVGATTHWSYELLIRGLLEDVEV